MRFRHCPLAVALLLLPPSTVTSAGSGGADTRCRCAQLTIERYYQQADIVVVGRARSVRRVPAGSAHPERLEVMLTPVFRAEGAFKGSLDGVTLTTPTSSAACGVAVETGGIYVLFANLRRDDPLELAWFDSCGGSRRYPDSGAPADDLFLGLTAREALARLFEMADGPSDPLPGGEFHTSPACWQAPRIFHQGDLPAGLQAATRITRVPGPFPNVEGVLSPNGAYRAHADPRPVGDAALILVDVERPAVLQVAVSGVQAVPALRWVSEKLLFFRAMQGRVQFTDVLVDVELGRVVYQESARYGQAAFEQYQAACLGQCPCAAVAGSADSLATPPQPQPRPAELPALQRLAPENLAFLDADWDGRIFTEAGGRRFTVSALHGVTGRDQYPIRLHEAEFVNGAWWLRVSLFAEEPCTNPHAAVVHAGWVPAFSRAGYLVAGTSPGGC